ncbi:hypothetical protein NXW84_17745 [Bacteroides fragilis]|nr:hypothetical protein NXW84_17745 [Bacteroides fragilis]
MKGSYGDDYSAVGLLAGGGSYLTWVFPGKMGIRRLQSSSSAGLEYCIERSGISPCYLSMDKLSDADVLKNEIYRKYRIENWTIPVGFSKMYDGRSAVHKKRVRHK